MPEESTTRDLVELTRRALEAFARVDVDAVMSFYAPDAVWKSVGLGTSFEGRNAIRGFVEDWTGAYEEFDMQPIEILELRGGVTLAVILQRGRPLGSTGHVEFRFAAITEWVEGLATHVTNYIDIDEARAAAERLTQERE
jgi:ketosteroid isomerase-like protein